MSVKGILKNLWHDGSARKALLVILPVLLIGTVIHVLEFMCNQLLKVVEKLACWSGI